MEYQKMVHFLLIVQDHLRNKNVHRMLSLPLTYCHGNILDYTILPFQLSRKDLKKLKSFYIIDDLNLIK